eukprot:1774356-Rhodomonas_salina.1
MQNTHDSNALCGKGLMTEEGDRRDGGTGCVTCAYRNCRRDSCCWTAVRNARIPSDKIPLCERSMNSSCWLDAMNSATLVAPSHFCPGIHNI